MKRDEGYHDFVVYDLMANFPNISSRPMMSGWAIYSNGIPFAGIISNHLYFKAKGERAQMLEELGWARFQYEKTGGKIVTMNYWRVPDETLDDQEVFNEIMERIVTEGE